MNIITINNLENIIGGSLNIKKFLGIVNKAFNIWHNISLSLRKTNLGNYVR